MGIMACSSAILISRIEAAGVIKNYPETKTIYWSVSDKPPCLTGTTNLENQQVRIKNMPKLIFG